MVLSSFGTKHHRRNITLGYEYVGIDNSQMRTKTRPLTRDSLVLVPEKSHKGFLGIQLIWFVTRRNRFDIHVRIQMETLNQIPHVTDRRIYCLTRHDKAGNSHFTEIRHHNRVLALSAFDSQDTLRALPEQGMSLHSELIQRFDESRRVDYGVDASEVGPKGMSRSATHDNAIKHLAGNGDRKVVGFGIAIEMLCM